MRLAGLDRFFGAGSCAEVTELECRYAGTDFVYDCRIALERGGQPLSGAEITVGADMPSMPMAHNVKPVKAKPTSKPGEYQARLELEMPENGR